MITNKEHDRLVGIATARAHNLLMCLARPCDFTRRTGKIKGEESRYTLQVWYRRTSGTAYAVITHHHPRQSDSIIGDGQLDDMEQSQRINCCRSEESRAIYEMLAQAVREHGQSLLPSREPAVVE